MITILILIGVLILACLLLPILFMATFTGIWLAISRLIEGVVYRFVKTIFGLGGLLLFFYLIFKFFPHEYSIK